MEPLLGAVAPRPAASLQRWWALTCWNVSIGFVSNAMWLTFSVDVASSKEFLGCGQPGLDLLAVMGTIVYIPVTIVTNWICSAYGIRAAFWFSSACINLGSMLRMGVTMLLVLLSRAAAGAAAARADAPPAAGHRLREPRRAVAGLPAVLLVDDRRLRLAERRRRRRPEPVLEALRNVFSA